MNKQQLANKIWESANKLRSKIEANEYKDYILGFMFYKYLSDRELKFARDNGFSEADIQLLSEDDAETVKYIRENIGFFIAYKDLFSTWISMGRDFDVSNVRDALSAFSRLINDTHKKVFENIFRTLETGLSKLGENSGAQTKAISSLIYLIKDIPMNGRQDYDVLGFIYEYLISMFAANAGKKAGEFYTPHEVSLLMSEIVAHHLNTRQEIKIYDPTSGSGSLLINIGRSVAKHMENANNIQYYAQELKENTYNLTRMNLVMRGILPANIITRNGDTLEDDWPFFDESNPVETYNPLYVDAVVSNPPYSQHWTPAHKETDPRYARFGLAPKSKADYAFLLHDLYHLKPDGIMTIVLPHGVLFRGGSEGEIRKKLIESNHIDAVIGLPANIFFGTGIPTIIMVLRQQRRNSDTLMIDASNGFVKEGKNNRLRASDIRKIVDAVIERCDIEGFSRQVSRDEIRGNEYNLNIPRYINSSQNAEHWDITATMFGGIPKREIDELDRYWRALPSLRESLFCSNGNYADLAVDDIAGACKSHPAVLGFKNGFAEAFTGFAEFLRRELIGNMSMLNIAQEEALLSGDIFTRLAAVPLIDKYEAYQLLDDEWAQIAVDLEIIQTEGMESIKKVDPNMVMKKKDGKEEELQEGWRGRIIPFELVQAKLLKADYDGLKQKEHRLEEIAAELETIIESLAEDEKDILNDTNDAFAAKNLAEKLKDIFADIETAEMRVLTEYLELSRKSDKKAYIAAHSEISWDEMEAGNDGTYGKPAVKAYLQKNQAAYEFPEDSFEKNVVQASRLLAEEKELKGQIKQEALLLHQTTKATIEALSDAQVLELLEAKWIVPLVEKIHGLPEEVLSELTVKVKKLSEKYATTLAEVEEQIGKTEQALASLLGELTGSEDDMRGIHELQKLLRGK